MVWFTDKQNKTHLVWTSKDNKTMIPEVQIIDDGKCFWKVTEEGRRPVGGEVTGGVVDAMNAVTSYIDSEIEKRKDPLYLDVINAKAELNLKLSELDPKDILGLPEISEMYKEGLTNEPSN